MRREVHPTVPPGVEYGLTPLGRTLLEPLPAPADRAVRHEAGKSSKASRRKKARAASYKEFPGSRPAPVASRGVDPLSGLPKIAPAYMRLTPEEAQRERQRRLTGGNKAEKRRLAKLARKMQAARKSGAGR